MALPDFENVRLPESFADVVVKAPEASEDWTDPEDKDTWGVQAEVTSVSSSVDVPHVQHGLAAASADLLARTDTLPIPVINLQPTPEATFTEGLLDTEPLPIITPEQPASYYDDDVRTYSSSAADGEELYRDLLSGPTQEGEE